MPSTHHRHYNHVLLLRHCVRSTKATITTCHDDGNNVVAKTQHRVNITEYISAPLPKWSTPPMWCTARGMDIIEQEGTFLIHQLFGNITTKTNVQLRFISDRSHRDSDTAYSLSKGMMKVLHNSSEKLLTFRGMDEIQFAQEIFKVEIETKDTESIGLDPLCPRGNDYSDDDLSNEITQRLSQLPPSDFGVPELVDLLVSLGGLDAQINNNLNISSMQDHRCPGSIGLSLNVLKEMAEMAFYSRASAMTPPFLPSATFTDVYRMLLVGDYVRSVERLDNVRAAKGGVVLAKSMLAALEEADFDVDNEKSDGDDTATVTVYVGHDSDIDNLATALGLRWTMPPPFLHGNANEQINHNIIGTPPGSGMLFSSSSTDQFQDVSMSFVCAVNLMEETETTFVKHTVTPIFPFDSDMELTEHGHYRTDDETGTAGIVTLDYLQSRLQATLDRYPTLQPCYDKAPIIVGGNNRMAREGIGIAPSTAMDAAVLAAWIVANVILCACLFCLLIVRRARSQTGQRKYEQVHLEAAKKSSDFELA